MDAGDRGRRLSDYRRQGASARPSIRWSGPKVAARRPAGRAKASPSRSSSGVLGQVCGRSAAGRSAACECRRPRPRTAFSISVELQRQAPASSTSPYWLPRNGTSSLLVEEAAVGVPFDIEVAGEVRSRPHSRTSSHQALSDPPTPIWFGHEVEDLPQAVRSECATIAREVVLPAELGIERVVIDDVVAVRASRPRLQIGRGIEWLMPSPADMDRSAAAANCRNRVELQAVCRPRNGEPPAVVRG